VSIWNRGVVMVALGRESPERERPASAKPCVPSIQLFIDRPAILPFTVTILIDRHD
jgi:hypothetical protein